MKQLQKSLEDVYSLEAKMLRDIFRKVSSLATSVSEDDGHHGVVVDLTLKNLFGITDSSSFFLGDSDKLIDVVSSSDVDSDMFLEVYLKVVANDHNFELVIGKKREFEAHFDMTGIHYLKIAGEEDVAVEWSHRGYAIISAFSWREAHMIAEEEIAEQSESYSTIDVFEIYEGGVTWDSNTNQA